jgi:hypothetical protein
VVGLAVLGGVAAGTWLGIAAVQASSNEVRREPMAVIALTTSTERAPEPPPPPLMPTTGPTPTA